ncbi:MAG TPA: tryptophan--tRNA ligase [Candidatus Portnoybacteria bacterium]|nr:tryptophan--tRNA ligase [Candidatus Portnoybacteria bacterium]
MKKQIVLSGVQPTGELHLGNYLGSLRNFVKLQNKYQCYFFIADYHSLTEPYQTKEKSKQVLDLALDFLAIGLNPQKSVIFVQSHVPEHTELAWILNCLTPFSHLKRMTQFKEKTLQQKENINVGLFDYPVLQAADILIYKTNLVPVGQDQVQHVELARDLARIFNQRFSQTFPQPKPLLTEAPKIMSLTDPTKKMSKSLGPKSYISLTDEPEVIAQKLKKAVTDSLGSAEEVEESPGRKNLFQLLDIFGSQKEKEKFSRELKNKTVKYSELKEVLAKDIAEHLADFRKKRAELKQKPDYIKKVLAEGNKKASQVAQETMKEVRKKIGLV